MIPLLLLLKVYGLSSCRGPNGKRKSFNLDSVDCFVHKSIRNFISYMAPKGLVRRLTTLLLQLVVSNRFMNQGFTHDVELVLVFFSNIPVFVRRIVGQYSQL